MKLTTAFCLSVCLWAVPVSGQPSDKLLWAQAGLLTGIQGLDLWTTEHGLRSGCCSEVNPLMRGSMTQRIVIKTAVTGGVIAVAHQLHRKGHPKWAVGLLAVSSVGVGAAVAWNVRQLRR